MIEMTEERILQVRNMYWLRLKPVGEIAELMETSKAVATRYVNGDFGNIELLDQFPLNVLLKVALHRKCWVHLRFDKFTHVLIKEELSDIEKFKEAHAHTICASDRIHGPNTIQKLELLAKEVIS